MIYKDAAASMDLEEFPANRHARALCLNCGENIWHHTGWQCDKRRNKGTVITNFYKLRGSDRFLTESMALSLEPFPCMPGDFITLVHSDRSFTRYTVTNEGIADITSNLAPIKPDIPTKHIDTDDWRAWAHNVPGECKCGIPIANCDYHRPTSPGQSR